MPLCVIFPFARVVSVRPAFRFLTLLLILALLFPVVVPFRSQARAKESLKATIAAGNLAAPQSFSYPAAAEAQTNRDVFLNFTKSVRHRVFAFAEQLSFNSIFARFTPASRNAIETVSASPALPPPSGIVRFDYDGDGKADVSRFQSSTGEWRIKQSGNGATTNQINQIVASDLIAPADYDGNNTTDIATFNPYNGYWKINGTVSTFTLGQPGDVPVSADYDGDGAADAAVFRASNGTWYVRQSSTNTTVSQAFGASGDIAVPGNYNADSYADYAVFRPSNGTWYVLYGVTGGSVTMAWGAGTDTPVPADYDGDNKTDYAVYRPSEGAWYAYKSSTADGTYLSKAWGNYGDQPVPADYDGDNRADFAVFRPQTGVWHIAKNPASGAGDYLYHQLGVSTDLPTEAAYLKKIGAAVAPPWLAKARISPKNATGGSNLYSSNFAWSSPLVGLPGRSGLDAGFGISYNSLVWTKVYTDTGDVMVFDSDQSNITPGFRFGFSVIEPSYPDYRTGRFTYLMVTPSGARVDFRQIGASEYYETGDSAYTQLRVKGNDDPQVPTPAEDLVLTVTTTDGTQTKYTWRAGAYRASEIKDRNGNFIAINHDEYGLLRTVTDTLGRTVTVNYDADLYPTTVTQTWKNNNGQGSDVTYNWATFAYTTRQLQHNFGSLAVYGPAYNTTIKVLDKVIFPNTSFVQFEYNRYGQVWRVNSHADDDHKLNHVGVNLSNDSSLVSGVLSDCPRFTETRTLAENFNQGQETVVTNSYQENQTLDGVSGLTLITVAAPDGITPTGKIYSKSWMNGGGWAEAIPFHTKTCVSEVCTGTDEKRRVASIWTQDDTSLLYPVNPRVTETKVSDAASTRRTTVDYHLQTGSAAAALYGLVKEVKVYHSDQITLLKRAATEYNLAQNYVSRRIIGLTQESKLFDGVGNLVSKVTFDYDQNGYTGAGQSVSPTQHDATNYGSGFAYRGNLTGTTRWNVNYPTDTSQTVSSHVKYNIAGSPVSQTDPRGRVSSLSYTDNWNDGVSRSATFAYPTALTDSGGFSSIVKYRYDIGANVWARSPVPAGTGNSFGKTTSRIYDDTTGRMTKEKIENGISGAYTRYEYPGNGASLNVYSTVLDANADGNINGSDEVLTETLFDGAGRVRKTRTENPNSTGGYAGKLFEYDILGRVKRETVPTEINPAWNPAGDDYRGMSGSDYLWLWKSLEYDWNGRVTKETNTDGTDRLYSYEGCGCAGGEVTTVKGEITAAIDNAGNQQTTKRRTQKIYADILGRTFKTEIWDLDGAGSAPYATTVNVYNARDQITNAKRYAGSDASTTYQETTMTYDGHGRLLTRHLPVEDSNAATSWSYNADDTVATVTEPRGATTAYKYGYVDDVNSTEYRALLTKIIYSVPSGSGIPDPADVSFSYDAAGNRTAMTDGTGSTAYSYDELSRLKSETKNFSDALANAPTGGYKLLYNYHLTGGLKSVEDPFGAIVTYSADKTGRMTAIGGSGFYDNFAQREITSYLSAINYRAFGGVKSMTFSTDDATQTSLEYNARLQPMSYQVSSSATTGGYVQKANYIYHNDGAIKEVDNDLDDRFSQHFDYDFAGRIKRNEFGTGSVGTNKPYKQTLGYNEFDNITNRSTWTWGTERSFTAVYANNRKTAGGYGSGTDTFDAAGNVTQNVVSSGGGGGDIRKWKFDAAGRMTEWEETAPYLGLFRDEGAILTFDGDARTAKRLNRTRNRANGNTTWAEEAEYTIYSSVTGQKITTLTLSGQKLLTFVYMNGSVIAEQNYGTNNNSELVFKHDDPVTGSVRQSGLSGELTPFGVGSTDTEAFGAVIPPQEQEVQTPDYRKGGHTKNPETGCQINSSPVQCDRLKGILNARGVSVLGGAIMDASVWRFTAYRLYDSESIEGNNRAIAGEKFKMFGRDLGIAEGSWYALYIDWQELSLTPAMQQQLVKHEKNFTPDYWNDAATPTARAGCDQRLAEIFGGDGARVGSTHDPLTLGIYDDDWENYKKGVFSKPPTGERAVSHGPKVTGSGAGDNGGIIHIYSDPRGITEGALYAPSGGNPVYHGKDKIGNYVLRVYYENGYTISFQHAVPLKKGAPNTNETGSELIGSIASNGNGVGYFHAHIIFYSNWKTRQRVDPRTIYCKR